MAARVRLTQQQARDVRARDQQQHGGARE
jgi:hypothetical protein